MNLDNYIESAGNLQRIEDEIITTKRQGMNTTNEQSKELNQAMDETLSFVAEAMNDGVSVMELAQAAQEFIGVDGDSVFGYEGEERL